MRTVKVSKKRIKNDMLQEALALLVINGIFSSMQVARMSISKECKKRYEDKYLNVKYIK